MSWFNIVGYRQMAAFPFDNIPFSLNMHLFVMDCLELFANWWALDCIIIIKLSALSWSLHFLLIYKEILSKLCHVSVSSPSLSLSLSLCLCLSLSLLTPFLPSVVREQVVNCFDLLMRDTTVFMYMYKCVCVYSNLQYYYNNKITIIIAL